MKKALPTMISDTVLAVAWTSLRVDRLAIIRRNTRYGDQPIDKRVPFDECPSDLEGLQD